MIIKLDTDEKCWCGRDAEYHLLQVEYGKTTEKHQCNKCRIKEEESKRSWENFKPGDMK